MNKRVFKICFSGILFAVGYILPFLTGQIPEIGNMFCPMHLPILICGLICGWKYGVIVGITLPIFRSLTIGMPPLYPTAIAMAIEMGMYGFITGLFNKKIDKVWKLYFALISAMLLGRLVWGLVMWIIALTNNIIEFSFNIFITGAFLTAWPGILIQLILVPIVVMSIKKFEDN